MSTSTKQQIAWGVPALSTVIGVVYLISAWIGGAPRTGLVMFAIMAGFAVVLVLAGRRSETVRGLLDHRDERINTIDLRATAITALALIAALLIGFVGSVARGGDGSPYSFLCAIGGGSYVLAVIILRIRG